MMHEDEVSVLVRTEHVTVGRDLIQNVTIKRERREDTKPQNVLCGLLDNVFNFTGREKEIDYVLTSLRTHKKLAVVGLGGTGKTELVKKCAWLWYKEDERNRSVAWLNAETIDSLTNSVNELCEVFQMKQTSDPLKTMKCVYNEFANAELLVVFDNVEDIKIVKRMSPTAQHNKSNIYLLCTSQLKEWGPDVEIQSLREMSEDDAVQLITTVLGDNCHRNDVVDLVRELQYLPLALQHAAMYIWDQQKYGKRTYTVRQYLQDYGSLLDVPLPEYVATQNEKTVWATVNMTINKIRSDINGAMAIELMQILAYLLPHHIYMSDIKILKPHDELDNVIRILSKYCLIQKNCSITVHRLVQKVLRIYQEQQDENVAKDSKCQALLLALNRGRFIHFYSICRYIVEDDLLSAYRKKMYMESDLSRYELNIEDIESWSAIHWAAYSGHTLCVAWLVEYGVDVNKRTKMGWTALHAATVGNRHDTPVSIDENTYFYTSVILTLAKNVHLDVDATYGKGYTALHIACKMGRIQSVEDLLDAGADIEKVTIDSLTPATIARQNGHRNLASALDLIEQLKTNKEEDVELHRTVVIAHLCMHEPLYNDIHIPYKLRNLVKRGKDVNASAGIKKLTPLHFAVLKGLDHTVYTLIKLGATVNKADADGNTPAQLATLNGHKKLAIKLGLVNEILSDIDKKPFHVDVLFKDQIFLPDEENVNAVVTDRKLTPLHLAAIIGNNNILYHLIQMGAIANVEDSQHNKPSQLARQNGHESLANTLTFFEDIESETLSDWSELHVCSTYNLYLSPMHITKECVNSTVTSRKLTPLHLAAGRGCMKFVKLLVENGAHINQGDANNITPSQLARHYGHETLANVLTFLNDVIKPDNNWPLLHLQVIYTSIDRTYYKNLNSTVTDYELTPLHLAAGVASIENIKALMKLGADVRQLDALNRTAADLARSYNHDVVANILTFLEEAQPNENWPRLHWHIVYGDLKKEICLEKTIYSDINTQVSDHKLTPLHIAAGLTCQRSIKILAENGADFSLLDADKRTPARLAKHYGHETTAAFIDELAELVNKEKLNKLVDKLGNVLIK